MLKSPFIVNFLLYFQLYYHGLLEVIFRSFIEEPEVLSHLDEFIRQLEPSFFRKHFRTFLSKVTSDKDLSDLCRSCYIMLP